jgi:hypothetical protein
MLVRPLPSPVTPVPYPVLRSLTVRQRMPTRIPLGEQPNWQLAPEMVTLRTGRIPVFTLSVLWVLQAGDMRTSLGPFSLSRFYLDVGRFLQVGPASKTIVPEAECHPRYCLFSPHVAPPDATSKSLSVNKQ